MTQGPYFIIFSLILPIDIKICNRSNLKWKQTNYKLADHIRNLQRKAKFCIGNWSETEQPRKMFLYNRFFASSTADLKSLVFYKGLLGEMLGVMLLVFVACSSPYGDMNGIDQTRISLSFGLSVATIIWILANVSGGHINPAVSAAMFITRKISLVRFLLYVAVQCLGGYIGSALQKFVSCEWQTEMLGSDASCGLGLTVLGSGVSPLKGCIIEFIITFVLVMTVFAACDKTRRDLNGSGPLAIGLSVTMCHLGFIKLTGASMNPARTFGPAAILGNWQHHWVYWLGPITGGVLAGFLYEFVFAGDSDLKKFVAWVNSDSYGKNKKSIDLLAEDVEKGKNLTEDAEKGRKEEHHKILSKMDSRTMLLKNQPLES